MCICENFGQHFNNMINIEVIQLELKNKDNLEELLFVTTTNAAANSLAKELEEKFHNLNCPVHKDKISTLKLIVKKNKDFEIEIDKSGFCCEEFANKIKINF